MSSRDSLRGTGPRERALATVLLQGLNYSLGRGRDWSATLQESDFLEESKTILMADDEGAKQQLHIESFEFKEYAPRVFEDMRREGFDAKSARFRQSLCSQGSSSLEPLGPLGRSGSILFRTADKRFIVKTIQRGEGRFLLKILKNYHKHILNYSESLIVRLYGQWRLRIRIWGTVFKMRFLAMNSIFAPCPSPIDISYDLKGSYVNRRAMADKSVLKDCDLTDEGSMFGVPVQIRTQLLEQLEIDSNFLAHLGIMDYSLLVGVVDGLFEPTQNLSQFGAVAGADIVAKGRPRPVTVAVPPRDPTLAALKGREQRSSSSIPETPIPQKDFNVIRSRTQKSNESVVPDEIELDVVTRENTYLLGIIDFLTPYKAAQVAARVAKRGFLCQPLDGISTAPPIYYQRRFMEAMHAYFVDLKE